MVKDDKRECLNCCSPVDKRRALFCCERCRQVAELIRYARRKIADGTYQRPDIAEAITIRRGLLLGGGFYDKRGRAVSEEERHTLLTRSKGRCEKCGREFGPDGDARFTVQHIAAEDGFILEAWCYRCNMDDVLARAEPVNSGEQQLFALDFQQRVYAERPMRPCDDPDEWPRVYLELQRSITSATPRGQRRTLVPKA